ncbi:glycoside hydrolase family 2 TIM barrel-domain containing protein [Bacteroidota bacterium]
MMIILRFFLVTYFLGASSLLFAQSNDNYDLKHFLENPAFFSENQELPHVPLYPFNMKKEALTSNRDRSPYFKSLNGKWKFRWYKTPQDSPEEFYNVDFSTNSWDEILVPGTWQMQGYGHKIYRNIPLEFNPYDPPKVPDHLNPTGLYIRSFSIPEDWNGRKILIHFEGVKSAYWIWINGDYVGFDKGSMSSGEWDITKYLKDGENRIAVKAVRWSDGTYLEDQDMWRFSGIYRSVFLYSVPKIHIRDLAIKTDLDENYKDAELKSVIEIKNENNTSLENQKLEIQLFNSNKEFVQKKDIRLNSIPAYGSIKTEISLNVKDPLKWSAENPHLYQVLFTLKNSKGEPVEIVEEKLGFREIEIRNAQLLVNGVAVITKGVNRHEHDPELGRTMTEERIMQDLKLMKELNVNAIRTSHYPNDPMFYDLVDEYGLYICNEVNAECHEGENFLAGLPGWEPAFLDRMSRYYHRDKNHPSVIIWSTGNECGYAPVHHKMAEYVKKQDPEAIVYHQGNVPNGDAPYADINGIRYPELEELRMVGRTSDRPVIMGEYSHAMGNALGHFDDYWNIIYSERSLQGGYIWDWVNQGLLFDQIEITDHSPYHHQSVVMGTPDKIEGVDGLGLAFSGLDDFVEIYNHHVFNNIGNELTIETWVYPRSYFNINSVITKSEVFELTQYHPDSLSFVVWTDIRHEIKAFVPQDWNFNWHHIAGVYNGEYLSLFIDGELMAQGHASGKIGRSINPVCIGRNHKNNHENVGGFISNSAIDEVRIFPMALDIGETENLITEKNDKGKSILWLDFNEFENKGKFLSYGATPQSSGTMDGVVSADRVPQPEAWQMKQSQGPVYFSVKDRKEKKFEVANRYHFTNLDEIRVEWILMRDGVTIQHGHLPLETRPLQKEIITVPYSSEDFKGDSEYIIRFLCKSKLDCIWAPEGHEICFRDIVISEPEKTMDRDKRDPGQPFSITESNDQIDISGNDFTYSFSLTEGNLSSVSIHGEQLFNKKPEFSIWRKPIMNELSSWGVSEVTYWYKYGLDSMFNRMISYDIKKESSSIFHISFTAESRSWSHPQLVVLHDYTFSVFGNGLMVLNHSLIADITRPDNYVAEDFHLDFIQRYGWDISLSKRMTDLTWYGPGPFETYPDRKTGAKIGIWNAEISDINSPYIIPQAFDNRTDVRWFTITTSSGNGIKISGEQMLDISVDPYENLEESWYPFQLIRAMNPTLKIDYKVTGVGGTPIKVRPNSRTYPGKYHYKLFIDPVFGSGK